MRHQLQFVLTREVSAFNLFLAEIQPDRRKIAGGSLAPVSAPGLQLQVE